MTSVSGRTVVYVNNFPGPGLGGGERHLLEVVRAAHDAGMRVHVLCVPGSPLAVAARELGAAVVETPMGAAGALAAARRVRAYCARHGADILHTTGFLTNIVGRLAVRGDRPRLVTTVHVDPGGPRAAGGGAVAQALREAVDRLARSRVALVLPVSEAVAAALLARGYDASRMRVILNGVDPEAVAAAAAAPPPTLPENVPLAGVVARLEPVKAVDVFLRAAALVAARIPDARFAVAGDGPLRCGLESLAASLGLAGRVAFLGWVEPVEPLLARLDVCVLPSRSEGLPVVLLEAMALGVPVVASAVGGVPEVVEDGVTGALVPPGDAGALAVAIERFLSDAGARAAAGGAARDRVGESFSLRGMRDAHIEAYAALLGEGGGGFAVRE